jgi:hypothetical protein
MDQYKNTAADTGCPPGFERCTEVLERERALAAKIAEMQALTKKAAFNRQWLDFEARMEALEQAGAQFEELDRERDGIFTSVAGPSRGETSGFYAFVSRLPVNEREALTNTYRNLKMEIMKIRLENESLTNYLAEVRFLVEGFLDAAFPDRKGRMYSRSGVQIKADMRSVVLNRHF